MLCDPCVSACALLSFALKAPILGTGLFNLKTTTLTPCYRKNLRSLFGTCRQVTELLLKSSLGHVILVDGVCRFNTPKSEQVVVFRLDFV